MVDTTAGSALRSFSISAPTTSHATRSSSVMETPSGYAREADGAESEEEGAELEEELEIEAAGVSISSMTWLYTAIPKTMLPMNIKTASTMPMMPQIRPPFAVPAVPPDLM